jgi:hypothetical protein
MLAHTQPVGIFKHYLASLPSIFLPKVEQIVVTISPCRKLSPFRIYLVALQLQFSYEFSKS